MKADGFLDLLRVSRQTTFSELKSAHSFENGDANSDGNAIDYSTGKWKNF